MSRAKSVAAPVAEQALGLTRTRSREQTEDAGITRNLEFRGGGGQRIAAECHGDVEHPPVLILPAGGQTRIVWRGVARALGASGRFAICADLRGHGDSETPADGRYDLDAYIEDLRAVLAQLPSRPVVVGASIGGLAALAAVGESETALAAGLVLVGVTPWIRPASAAEIARRQREHVAGFANLDAAAAALASLHPLEPRPDDAVLSLLLQQKADGRLYWLWDARFLNGLDLAAAAPRLAAAAARVKSPTLVVRGSASTLVPAQDAERLREMIAGSELVEIEGASHLIASEREDHFNAVLLEFLERRIPREPIVYIEGAEPRTLRDALGCFATGVTVVTTDAADGKPIGLTANSFTSVSLDPPLVLFCLARNSANLRSFETCNSFGINVLHIGQQPISARFATRGEDRFAELDWERWNNGSPLVKGALASLDCTTYAVHDGGDHLILIGRVKQARFEPNRDPLLYFRGKYRRLHFS